MSTPENHLHNINLISEVVESVFNQIKVKHDFKDHSEKSPKSYDTNYIYIEKNEILFYAFISDREAYELSFRNKDDERWKNTTFTGLVSRIYPMFSKESAVLYKEQYDQACVYERYTYDWYYAYVSYEVKFLENFLPQLFETGTLK